MHKIIYNYNTRLFSCIELKETRKFARWNYEGLKPEYQDELKAKRKDLAETLGASRRLNNDQLRKDLINNTPYWHQDIVTNYLDQNKTINKKDLDNIITNHPKLDNKQKDEILDGIDTAFRGRNISHKFDQSLNRDRANSTWNELRNRDRFNKYKG